MIQPSPLSFYGGLQLLLDLKRAFDCVDRAGLLWHLPRLQVSAEICSILAAWYSQTYYHVSSGPSSTPVLIGKGVKQGCKISPTLWLAFLHQLFEKLIPKTGLAWIRDHITVFADDLHLSGGFKNKAEFLALLTNIGHVLDILEEMQLLIQYNKSQVILATAGHQSQRILSQFIQRTDGAFIQFQRPSGQTARFPLGKKAVYLGIVVSYDSFEHETFQHRLRAAQTAFGRLKSWLNSKQMCIQYRLRLWRTCILPILTYGLHATTLNLKDLFIFQTKVFTMLRHVVRDHAFHTGHSNQQILQRFHLAHPLELLHDVGRQLWHTVTRRTLNLAPDDILHTIDWAHLPDFQLLISHAFALSRQDPSYSSIGEVMEARTRLQCPWCSFQTTSVPNLRRHCTKVHQAPVFRIFDANFSHFAYKGTPQCSHCFESFGTWRQFCIHLERNVCQASTRHPGHDAQPSGIRPAGTTALLRPGQLHVVTSQSFGAELLQLVRDQNWSAILANQTMTQWLTHHCPCCGLWHDRTQEVHTHLRMKHGQLLSGVFEKSSQLSTMLCSTSPCPACGKEFRRSHTCAAMTHAALMWLNTLEKQVREDVHTTCSVCQLACGTYQALHEHLRRVHNVQLCVFNSARDTISDGLACAHCGAIFPTREGMRQHITDARCPSFDASASTVQTMSGSAWTQFLQGGDFHALRQDASKRLEYTLRCQFCSTRFSRQNDLSAHLAQVHPDLWQSSQGPLRLLLATAYQTHGCYCNPATIERSVTHICPVLRQVAMAYAQSDLDILVPTQFHDNLIQQKLQHLRDTPVFPLIRDALMTRDFAALWTNSNILAFLSNWCLICGGPFHHAELALHLQRDHKQETQDTLVFLQFISDPIARPFANCASFLLTAMDFTAWAPDSQDQEMMDAFRELAPYLRLPADKRTREAEPALKQARPRQQRDQEDPKPVMVFLQRLATLVIQHDKDLCLQRKQDSFIFFMQTSSMGILPGLTKAATEWKKSLTVQQDKPQDKPPMPLRAHLMTFLINSLHQRVQAVSESKPGEELWDHALKQGTILADGTWPFMHGVLLELVQEVDTVVKFQSLRPQAQTVAWCLQLGARADECWTILQGLTQSTSWSLMGVSMKSNSQHLSKVAQQVQEMMGKGKSNQKGAKGKGKSRPT
eukprot:s2933_g6.t1